MPLLRLKPVILSLLLAYSSCSLADPGTASTSADLLPSSSLDTPEVNVQLAPQADLWKRQN